MQAVLRQGRRWDHARTKVLRPAKTSVQPRIHNSEVHRKPFADRWQKVRFEDLRCYLWGWEDFSLPMRRRNRKILHSKSHTFIYLLQSNYKKPDLLNMKNMYMHLTNFSLNKNSDKFKVAGDDFASVHSDANKQLITSVWKKLAAKGRDVRPL